MTNTNRMQKHSIHGLSELRTDSFRFISICVLLVAYVWGHWVLFSSDHVHREFVSPSVLSVGCVAALSLRQRRPFLAVHILTFSLCACTLVSFWFSGSATGSLLIIPTVLFVGVLYDPLPMLGLSSAVGVAIAVIIRFRHDQLWSSPAMLSSLAVLAVASFASYLSSRSLYATVRWAVESYNAALEAIERARDRQGQLNRALKSMDEASARLQRVNFQLACAHDAAEELRRLKQRFVTNISHELRTPLSLIAGFSEMVYLHPESYDVPLPQEYMADVREIYRNSQHLIKLIDDVLDLSRMSAGKMPLTLEEVDPQRVLHGAVEMIRPLIEGKGLTLNVQIETPLPTWHMDPSRIQQVLINLLNNARRFTDSGTITVRASHCEDEMRISVLDTGIGIPCADQHRLFEEFEQVHAESSRSNGQGLGLAISKEFVEGHGGRIWAESEGVPGKGTTVHFTLPVQQQQHTKGPSLIYTSRRPPQARESSLLLLDDDPDLSAMLRRRLEGFHLVPASDDCALPRQVRESGSVAVLSTSVPGREFQCLDELYDQLDRCDAPFVICSLGGTKELADALGARAYLTKPVRRDRLLEALQCLGEGVRRILVVDDDPRFVHLLSRMILSANNSYEALRAHSGADGLRRLKEGGIDAIVLDLLMPEMDGRTFLDRMRQEDDVRNTPVIVVSGRWHELADDRFPARRLIVVGHAGGISSEQCLVRLQGILSTLAVPGLESVSEVA